MAESQMCCIWVTMTTELLAVWFSCQTSVPKDQWRRIRIGKKENHFINPSSVLFLPISWSSSWGESILQMTAVHQWLYGATISVVTEEKQKGLETRTLKKKKTGEKMCLWGSCISQSDTQLPLSLSLTNNRAVHYKLPCDSVWITLDWKIWTAWRYRGGTPLYLGQRVVRVPMCDLNRAGNQSSGGADSGTMHLWAHLSTTCGGGGDDNNASILMPIRVIAFAMFCDPLIAPI